MEEIGNFIAIAIGARKTGKTPFVLGDENLNIPGLIDVNIKKGMKVLFIDMIDHPSYRHIPIIQKEQIELWLDDRPAVYRCIETEIEGMRELQQLIKKYFWNGILICEDSFRYERDRLSRPMAAIIGNSKQQNVDVMFMYHSWKFVPLDLIIYLDFIEQFKSSSPPDKREQKEFGDNFQKVLDCYYEVKAHPSNYFHKSICVTQ